jgi:predicted heme/steroid binding protein
MRRFDIPHAGLWLFIILAAFLFMSPEAHATPEHSEKTGQGCQVCHITAEGGALTTRGLQYAASGYVWPPIGGYRVMGPIRKSIRFVVGYFHILAGFLWFGTIFYVHILLRPAYAAKGLPRGEVAVGLTTMAVVGVTGVLLTVSRIRSIGVLFESPWGLLLSVKIALYLVMVSTAIAAVGYIGPRLKRGMKRKAVLPEGGVFDPVTLSAFDGKEDRPAFVAVNDRVYDMTGLKLWRSGLHMKHHSGTDLTEALSKAPHGSEKLEGVRVAGEYDASRKPPRTPLQKAFYFIAYMNLFLVFAVLLVIAFWRWGI